MALAVEHLTAPGMRPEALALSRLLSLASALRSLSGPPREDLHGAPHATVERDGVGPLVPRVARRAGFASCQLLALEAPFVMLRLER